MTMQALPRPSANPWVVAIAWVCAVFSLLYFLPWAVAASRGKTNAMAIGLLNLLLGWTVIGWIIALVMACAAHQILVVLPSPPPPGPDGWAPVPTASR